MIPCSGHQSRTWDVLWTDYLSIIYYQYNQLSSSIVNFTATVYEYTKGCVFIDFMCRSDITRRLHLLSTWFKCIKTVPAASAHFFVSFFAGWRRSSLSVYQCVFVYIFLSSVPTNGVLLSFQISSLPPSLLFSSEKSQHPQAKSALKEFEFVWLHVCSRRLALPKDVSAAHNISEVVRLCNAVNSNDDHYLAGPATFVTLLPSSNTLEQFFFIRECV